MAQTLLPGYGFVSETGSEETILPGYGFVSETLSGNTPTTVTLAQGAWVWTGRAGGVDAQTFIALPQAAWVWLGRPLASAVATFQNMMLFFGIGP